MGMTRDWEGHVAFVIVLFGVSFVSLSAIGADISNGADNFSKSEEVTAQRGSASHPADYPCGESAVGHWS